MYLDLGQKRRTIGDFGATIDSPTIRAHAFDFHVARGGEWVTMLAPDFVMPEASNFRPQKSGAQKYIQVSINITLQFRFMFPKATSSYIPDLSTSTT